MQNTKNPNNGLGSLCYFLGFLTLLLAVIIVIGMDSWLNTPYWSIGGGVIWLMFIVGATLFVAGANFKKTLK